MEVINVGTIEIEDAIKILLTPDNLLNIVGRHGSLCFVLVREMAAPNFYSHLIENASTIDSTTRNHIAFVVFYGENSAVVRPGTQYSPYYGRYVPCNERYSIPGISISSGRDIHIRDQRELPLSAPEMGLGQTSFYSKFDQILGYILRYFPSQVDRPSLSQYMGKASRIIMERYLVSEFELPCLLFVNGVDPTQSVVVRLSERETLLSLYNDVLRVVSQEFAELSRFWKQLRVVDFQKNRIKNYESDVRGLLQKIAYCDEQLNRATKKLVKAEDRYSREFWQWQELEKELKVELNEVLTDPSTFLKSLKSVHCHLIQKLKEELANYQKRIDEVKAVESDLKALDFEKTNSVSPAHIAMERAKWTSPVISDS